MKNVSTVEQTAEYFTNVILPNPKEIGTNAVLVDQSHGGARVMSGVKNGLKNIIRDTHMFSIYVHCLAIYDRSFTAMRRINNWFISIGIYIYTTVLWTKNGLQT